MKLILEHERAAIFHGDSAELGEYLPENSIDAIVTDPPAGIGFMGRDWDDDRGGRDAWSQWLADLFAPSFRALKPGGHALVWALPRVSHWTARGLELAGFELRDVHHDMLAADDLLDTFARSLDLEQRAALTRLLESQASPIMMHLFGQGFPKSLDLKREIDMHLCELPGRHYDKTMPKGAKARPDDHLCPAHPRGDEAALSRTAFKPAVEHWILARKPLSEATYVENVLAHGTGGINVEACRIGNEEVGWGGGGRGREDAGVYNASTCGLASPEARPQVGRWPAHLSLQHASGCVETGAAVETVQVYDNAGPKERADAVVNYNLAKQVVTGEKQIERVEYTCAPGCPVAELDAQSGVLTSGNRTTVKSKARTNIVGSKGGASRFFYTAKPARSEKDAGLDHLPARSGGEATGREDGSAGTQNPRAGAGRTGGARNVHPCCKSLELMSWLVRLVTPPGGTVLDPFAGSGSTGVAALAQGFSFIGAEQGGPGDEYVPILLGRIRAALGLPQEQAEPDAG